ncbi:aminopeptidase P family protein [Deltaproteobacteria bacterium TL4]
MENSEKLNRIKTLMTTQGISYYLVPSTDEHLNEYLPEQHQRLKTISGFSGSAGMVILCLQGKHQLFVDSRYHIQADQETNSDFFEVHKLGQPKVLTPEKWLAQQEQGNGSLKVGVDPFVMSGAAFKKFKEALTRPESVLVPLTPNWVDASCDNNQQRSFKEIFSLDLAITGESQQKKLDRVRQKMKEQEVDLLILTSLDDIAWLLNLRGHDIAYNPFFEAYALILREEALCFCHKETLPANLENQMPEWQFQGYASYSEKLQSLAQTDKNLKIWIDAEKTTMGTRLIFQEKHTLLESQNPLVLMKALKNDTELQGIRKAHLHAACAKIRCMYRLEKAMAQGTAISEKMVSTWLSEEDATEENFVDLSFETIAAFGKNAAIVHYSNPDENVFLKADQLLLLDSGIQYLGGTTDDTRTFILGDADEKQRRLYTYILKAHISLARQIFPEGTKGVALDAITRSTLWNQGLDFGHGTGHGVGAFLSVHEGPQRISPSAVEVTIQPQMVLSIEPGYYEEGWGGIRLENLYVVTHPENLPTHPEQKKWLCFEALTLIPFARKLIDLTLLGLEERQWLGNYNARILEEVGPLLQDREIQFWLRNECLL